MRTITLLGSTGSVGKNVLDIIRRYPERFRAGILSSNENVSELVRQAKEFRPKAVVIGKKELYRDLEKELPPGIKPMAGAEALEEAASEVSDMVFLAISGTAALKPLLASVKKGRTIALASKEPIVSAGKMIMSAAAESGSRIIPVDSEHSAVMQCLTGRDISEVRTVYITGSGGSLRNVPIERFDSITVEEVLAHPKWDMGRKITVDSATLMNKGLEVIEARWLFDVPPEKIKVVIHPEAIVHSLVEFIDGTVSAAMFRPDMKFPILRALGHPEIISSDLARVDPPSLGRMTFEEPDNAKFPALGLAYEVLSQGGSVPAVLNGANEEAVGLFLKRKISFTSITRLVMRAVEAHKKIDDPGFEEIQACQKWAREEVLRSCLHG